MPGSTTQSKEIAIPIIIELQGLEFSSDEIEMIRQRVNQYVVRLTQNLGIPVAISLSLSVVPATMNQPSVVVKINHENIRTTPALRIITQQEARSIASTICESIMQNRALFVNGAVCQILRDDLFRQNTLVENVLPLNVFQQLAVILVTRGFSLDLCWNLTEQVTGNPLQMYEALVRNVDLPRVTVTYSSDLHEKMHAPNKSLVKLNEMSELMQDGLFYELGVAFPKIIWASDDVLVENECQILINNLCHPITQCLKSDELLVNDTVDRLTLLGVEGRESLNPANSTQCAIINEASSQICESAGLTTWDPAGYLILYTSSQLRKSVGSYLNTGLVENYLDVLSDTFPTLVNTVRIYYSVTQLTAIFRDLLDEEISIRDLRNILDNLLLINGTTQVDISNSIVFFAAGSNLVPSMKTQISELNPHDYTDYIRMAAYKRYITHKYTRGGNTLVVYLLDSKIEELLRSSKIKSLSSSVRKNIMRAIGEEIDLLPPSSLQPVILTNYDLRRTLRELIAIEFPHLAILCYQELSPDISIQPIARIALST